MITSILNIIIGGLAFIVSALKKKYYRIKKYYEICVIIIAFFMVVIGIMGIIQKDRDEEIIRKAIHRYGTIIHWSDTELSITGTDLEKHKNSEYIAILKIFPSKNPKIKALNIVSEKEYYLNGLEPIQEKDAVALMLLFEDIEGKIEVKKEFQNDIDTIYFFGKYESKTNSIILKCDENRKLFIHPRIYKSLSDMEENYFVLLIEDLKNPSPRFYDSASFSLKTNIGKYIILMGFQQIDQQTNKIYNSPIRIVGGKIQKNRFY